MQLGLPAPGDGIKRPDIVSSAYHASLYMWDEVLPAYSDIRAHGTNSNAAFRAEYQWRVGVCNEKYTALLRSAAGETLYIWHVQHGQSLTRTFLKHCDELPLAGTTRHR